MNFTLMAHIYQVLDVGKKALDYYAKKIDSMEKNEQIKGADLVKTDLERLSERVKRAQEAMKELVGDSFSAGRIVRENKEILCLAVDDYLQFTESVKLGYWKSLGERPEALEKEINVIREVKSQLCA